MNGHCNSCEVEAQCAYPYKPTDCCDQRKFRPIAPSLPELCNPSGELRSAICSRGTKGCTCQHKA